MPPARLAVLASGSGTLLDAILRDGITVTVVVADRPCRALEVARSHGVPAELVERTEWGPGFDRKAYGERLIKVLRSYGVRSEEHTSELQSRPHLVCRLL